MTDRVTLPTSKHARVSIVIVSAKNAGRLVRCLSAIARETPHDIPVEVILVLNAPEPELDEVVDRDVAGARVIRTDVPLGFAGGLNLGARHAGGEFIHLLHDDTEVGAGWLEPLVGGLEANGEAGAAGSLILDPRGDVQAAGWVLRRDGTTAAPWTGGPPEADSFGDSPFTVDYAASASLLVHREVWETAGGADEDLHPAYYVDVDLAMAFRKQGRTVICVPRSRVRHERAGTAGTRLARFATERNRERFVAKWANELALGDTPARSPVATPQSDGDLTRPEGALLRDLAFKSAYIDHLEAGADDELQLNELLTLELNELRHERDGLAGRLELIEATRWWRLRRLVLPAVAVPRRLEGFIRRAVTSRTR